MRTGKRNYLVVDANRYMVRLGIVESDGYLHESLEARPQHIDTLVSFAQARAPAYGITSLIGSPLDQWPDKLQFMLEEVVGCTQWISPAFLRSASAELGRWQYRRKFDRARLLALAALSTTDQHYASDDIVRRWLHLIADEVHQHLSDVTPRISS